MAVKLDGARRAVAKLMQDECWIERAHQERMRRLDEQTGDLIDSMPSVIVYTGPCLITPRDTRALTEGGRERLIRTFSVKIPWDADLPGYYDVVIPTASTYDQGLVGKRMLVEHVDFTSFLVWRNLIVTELE